MGPRWDKAQQLALSLKGSLGRGMQTLPRGQRRQRTPTSQMGLEAFDFGNLALPGPWLE